MADFKAAIISMLQEYGHTDGKMKRSQRIKKRYKGEPNEDFRNEKYNNQNKKFTRWAQNNSRTDMTEERVNELDDRSIEMIRFKQTEEKKTKKRLVGQYQKV